jgi:hypothetical protein
VVPEPEGELVVGVRPLFLRADKIVHSQQDTLKFREFVQVLGVHDFFVPDSSSDEGGGLAQVMTVMMDTQAVMLEGDCFAHGLKSIGWQQMQMRPATRFPPYCGLVAGPPGPSWPLYGGWLVCRT